MKTTVVRFVLVSLFSTIVSTSLFGQELDPKAIAKLVGDGTIKFSSKGSTIIWLDEKQYYSIEPVVADKGDTYRTASEVSVAVKSAGLPSPPRPPPPPPHDSKPPRPVPIPPRPPGPRPSDHRPPRKSLAQLAEQGTVVGRLETGGISQPDLKLAKGSYTIALTTYEGKPVATLINASGEYVITFDEVFFLAEQ